MPEKDKSDLIFVNMLKVMTAIKKITKDQKNIKQNFMFRGIDDAYNALHNIMADNDIFCTVEGSEPTINEIISNKGAKGFHVIIPYKFIFHTIDGSNISTHAVGEAIDYGDKGCAKTLSIAHKSALFSTFLIPTGETPDPDKDSHDLKSERKSEEDVPDGEPTPKKKSGKKITEGQRKRLFAIMKENDWSQEQVKKLIFDYGKYESTKDIVWQDYQAICNVIEGKEPDAKPEQAEHGF